MLIIPIHLIVDCHAPPARRNRERRYGLVDCVSGSVYRERLVEQIVVALPLYLERHAIPVVVIKAAGDAGRKPFGVDVIPDIPDSMVEVIALSAPLHANSVHIHIDVEFKILGNREVRDINLCVQSQIVNTG